MKTFLSVAIRISALVCFAAAAASCDSPKDASVKPASPSRNDALQKPHSSYVSMRAPRVNPARVRQGDPDWQRATREIYAEQNRLETSLARLSKDAQAKSVLRRGNPESNSIALTFDDGPHPAFTPQILATLKKEGVVATFFVVGFMADEYPNLVRDIRDAGHEVGNHTYSHVTLTKLSPEEVLTEYLSANKVIGRLTGEKVRFCRPPGGDFNRNTIRCAESLGLTTVLWTDDPGDYANPGGRILLNREVARLSPGGIVLLHDGSQDTLDTLSAFIQSAKKRGFRFVSLADWMG